MAFYSTPQKSFFKGFFNAEKSNKFLKSYLLQTIRTKNCVPLEGKLIKHCIKKINIKSRMILRCYLGMQSHLLNVTSLNRNSDCFNLF